MRRVLTSSLLTVGCLALVSLSTGCYSTPKTESEAANADPDKYWTRHEFPPFKSRVGIKAAISEFTVEFVTGKVISAGGGALMVDPTELYLPIKLAKQVLGIGHRQTDFGDDLYKQLPQLLYDLTTAECAKEGATMLPLATVAGSAAYQQYERLPEDKSSFFRVMNPVGGDTGRIRDMKFLPVEGLMVINGAKNGQEIENVDAALIQETGADVVLRVRVRVGCHQGHASIECNSVITCTGKGVVGSIESNRSLISDGSVCQGNGYAPFQGYKYELDTNAYLAAMKLLYPTYIELAIGSGRKGHSN